MYSVIDDRVLPLPGSPIQIPPDQCLFSNSPMLFAAFHVFHRLLTPRHPPFALNSLATNHLSQSCWCLLKTTSSSRFLCTTFPNCQRTNIDETLLSGTTRTSLVEVNGIEPMASCVQGRRSPSWATPPVAHLLIRMVGLDGFEPSASRLSGVRSNQTELQAPKHCQEG